VTHLEVMRFTNIIKDIFNIDNTQVFYLLIATGITKSNEQNLRNLDLILLVIEV